MPVLKILIVGDVKGQFEKLYKRVNRAIRKNGPFDILLCVGAFFGQKDEEYEKYVMNYENVPIQTYILGPTNEQQKAFYPENLQKSCSINYKIIYLGQQGCYCTINRLKIAFLSGQVDGKLSESVGYKCESADILLTNCWPKDIEKLQRAGGPPITVSNPSPAVSKFVSSLKPWYHFAGTEDTFFEPPPYQDPISKVEKTSFTRFIGLASVGSPSQWLYAINFQVPRVWTPEDDLIKCVPSPFNAEPAQDVKPYSRYDLTAHTSTSDKPVIVDTSQRKRKRCHKKQSKPIPPENCWFCLKPDNNDNYLIIKIVNHSFVALCHGGISTEHIYIIPIQHITSYRRVAAPVAKELENIKSAIMKYFIETDKQVLFFERKFLLHHCFINCIPLPKTMLRTVKTTLQDRVKELELRHKLINPAYSFEIEVAEDEDYFLLDLSENERMVIYIEDQVNVDFIRQIVCEVLKKPHKADWRHCVLDRHEEKACASSLQKSMAPFFSSI